MNQDSSIPTIVLETPNADVPVLEEALAALELSPSSYSSLETGRAHSYVVADSVEQANSLAEKIRGLLREFWLPMLSGEPEITVQNIRQEDWANNWKKNFHVFHASERLVVKPSWEEYQAAQGEIVLPIDPGMCFGTGYHGTTRACLQFLDELQQEHGKLSFIDAGTGSGILSLGAKLLGYDPVTAFDMDPQCITQAQENFRNASVDGIDLHCAPLGQFTPKRKADVVAANILAVVLLQQATAVLDLIRPNGWAILSGILTEQYPDILRTFTALHCQELKRTTIGEWTSGLYHFVS